MTPIGRRLSGSVTARCAMPCCAMRPAASDIGRFAATVTSGVTAVAPAVCRSRSVCVRGDEVEVGDDRPQARRLVVLVRVLEDEDRVDVERRHHPRDDAQRRLGRDADHAAAHRVADGRGLVGDGQLVGMVCAYRPWRNAGLRPVAAASAGTTEAAEASARTCARRRSAAPPRRRPPRPSARPRG